LGLAQAIYIPDTTSMFNAQMKRKELQT
jgi:hypothetical protein